MPGIHIDFTKEEYDSMPTPRRTWCREVLLKELRTEYIKSQRDVVVDHPHAKYPLTEKEVTLDTDYAFKTYGGEFLHGVGSSQIDAWMRLGRSKAQFMEIQHGGTMEIAVAEGWWEEKGLLDV